jgi:ParB family transcriptional regulator, chromosome partitioning protein
MLATIPIGSVEIGRRLRDVTDAQVDALMSSIADVGLLNPITVYPRKVIRAGVAEDGYGLVAGAHRLEAVRRLGLADIDAQVVNLSELERQIAECDENLCGSVLTPYERAQFTQRRKEAYEALHPETKNGGDRKSDRKVCDLIDAPRFTADTAAKTGASERTIQLDAERGEKINLAAGAMLKGTALDTGVFLDKLKKIKFENQPEYVKRELDKLKAQAEKPKKSKPAPHAPDPDDDYSVREKQITALMNAWNKAGKEAREMFIERIGASL